MSGIGRQAWDLLHDLTDEGDKDDRAERNLFPKCDENWEACKELPPRYVRQIKVRRQCVHPFHRPNLALGAQFK